MTLSLSTHSGQIFHDKAPRQIFRATVAEHFYFHQIEKLELPETLPQEIPKKLKSKIKIRSIPLPLDSDTLSPLITRVRFDKIKFKPE